MYEKVIYLEKNKKNPEFFHFYEDFATLIFIIFPQVFFLELGEGKMLFIIPKIKIFRLK